MEIRISTLSENTANYGLLAEWGLSILVEVDNFKVLVDTGLSFSVVHNAQIMGIDLSAIDRIVLSHSHPDHTGGLRDVLRLRGRIEVIAHPDILSPKYGRRDEGSQERYIGIPFSREELENIGACFKLETKPVFITDRIITTGEIPLHSSYENIEEKFFVKENGGLRPDNLADDLALVIDTDFGLVVILGCAHRGIVNTIRHAQNLTGKSKVYAVIGGTHLIGASEERMKNTIADLRDIGIQKLGVSHCTGFYASTQLAQEFEDIFFLNNAGTNFTLP